MNSVKCTKTEERNVSDSSLIQQTLDGNEEAFEYLTRRHQKPLFRYMLKILNDEDQVYDIWQQVLIQLYRTLPLLAGRESVRTWLFKTAYFRSIDIIRHSRHEQVMSQLPTFAGSSEWEDSPLELLLDRSPLPEEICERHEIQEQICQAIKALPDKYRLVVALRYTTESSFGKIGQLLGLPEATVKTRFYRSKPYLRKLLKDLERPSSCSKS